MDSLEQNIHILVQDVLSKMDLSEAASSSQAPAAPAGSAASVVWRAVPHFPQEVNSSGMPLAPHDPQV